MAPARFVPQSVVSSDSKSARKRLAYLDPIVPRIDELIREYADSRPAGETWTLHVLTSLGREVLTDLAAGRTLDTVKQDVGRLVPIQMSDAFSADRVSTLRSDGGGSSSRPTPRSGPDWVSSYTPHRLRPPSSEERIVLDTMMVCGALDDAAALRFLESLTTVRGRHPVSMAEPAWAELMNAFRSKPHLLAAWKGVVGVLNDLLDPSLPIVPSGREAASLAGLGAFSPHTPADTRRFYRLLWRFTAAAQEPAHFARKIRMLDPADGSGIEIGPFDVRRLVGELDERKRRFMGFVQRVLAAEGMSTEDVVAMIRDGLLHDVPLVAVDQLDFYIRAVTAYGEDLRRADRREVDPNDAIDLDILFVAVLPARICTRDRHLLHLAKRAESGDSELVMHPDDLLRWLVGRSTPDGD